MTHIYRYNTFLVLIAVLVLACIGVWMFVLPWFESMIGRQQDAIQQFYALQEYRSAQMGRLSDWQEQSRHIMQNQSNIESLLTEDRVVDFIKVLEAAAEENRVEIEISSNNNGAIVTAPKKGKQTASSAGGGEENNVEADGKSTETLSADASLLERLPYQTYLPLTLKVGGSYSSITTFLYQVETLPYLLDVVSIALHHSGEEENKQQRTQGSGVNPFLLTPAKLSATTEEATATGNNTVSEDSLEGVFELVVYIRK